MCQNLPSAAVVIGTLRVNIAFRENRYPTTQAQI